MADADGVDVRNTDGSIRHFDTVIEAKKYWASKQFKVSKLSFTSSGVDYRFRPRHRQQLWNSYSEARLKKLSPTYVNLKTGWIWIDQLVMHPLNESKAWDLERVETDKDYSDQYMASLIRGVYTDEEFQAKFM